jgi:hypothetical protein
LENVFRKLWGQNWNFKGVGRNMGRRVGSQMGQEDKKRQFGAAWYEMGSTTYTPRSCYPHSLFFFPYKPNPFSWILYFLLFYHFPNHTYLHLQGGDKFSSTPIVPCIKWKHVYLGFSYSLMSEPKKRIKEQSTFSCS